MLELSPSMVRASILTSLADTLGCGETESGDDIGLGVLGLGIGVLGFGLGVLGFGLGMLGFGLGNVASSLELGALGSFGESRLSTSRSTVCAATSDVLLPVFFERLMHVRRSKQSQSFVPTALTHSPASSLDGFSSNQQP